MMAFPSQCTYPDVLYRVTSTLTHPFDSPKTVFRSAARQRKDSLRSNGNLPLEDLRFEEQFPRPRAFFEKVELHIDAQHRHNGIPFDTPFISTTISLQYAISVAELHESWGARYVKITVIDTRALGVKKPIWDARDLANMLELGGSEGVAEWKNEFLIFDQLECAKDNSRIVRYHKIEPHLRDLLPNLLDARSKAHGKRFCNYFDDPTAEPIPLNEEAINAAISAAIDTAWSIAQEIAPTAVRLPIAINLMLLHLLHRDPSAVAPEVASRLVPEILRKSDLESLQILCRYRVLFTATHSEDLVLHVREFLEPRYQPPEHSDTVETRTTYEYLRRLHEALHNRQENLSNQLFELSTTALMVRRHTQRYPNLDSWIKKHDRGKASDPEKSGRVIALLTSFDLVKTSVTDAAISKVRTSPLSRLFDFLEGAARSLKAATRMQVCTQTDQQARLWR